MLPLLRLLRPGFYPTELDILQYVMPLRAVAQAGLAGGFFPLWDSYAQCGQALVGSPVSALFYPFFWLSLWGTWGGFYAYVLGHYFLLGAGGYAFLAGGLRVGIWPAIGGALVIASGGYMSSMFFSIHFTTTGWLLVTMWLWLSALRGRRGYALAAGIALSLAFTSGFLQEVITALVGLLLFTALWAWRGRPRLRLSCAVRTVATAGVTSFILCAAPLWYLIRSHGDSGRAGGLQLAEALAWSAHPIRVLELAIPYLWGIPTPGHHNVAQAILSSLGEHHSVEWAPAIFLGALFFALVFLPVRQARRGLHQATWLALVFCLLLAFGKYTLVLPLLLETAPAFGIFRYPQKWLLWVTVLAGVLTALKLERVGRGAQPRRLALRVAASSGLLGLLALAGAMAQKVAGLPAEIATRNAWTGVASLLLSVGVILACKRLPAAKAVAVLVLFGGCDLARSAWLRPITNRCADPLVLQNSQLGTWLDAHMDKQQDRFHLQTARSPAVPHKNQHAAFLTLITGSMKGAVPACWKIRTTGGLHPNQSARWARLSGTLTAHELETRLWTVASCRYLLDEMCDGMPWTDPVRMVGLREVAQALPRIRLVGHWTTAPNDTVAAAYMVQKPEFYWQQSVVAEMHTECTATARGTLEILEERSGLLRCQVQAEGPMILHLGDCYATGWRARIDDEETAVFPVNLAFIGVLVPAGVHEVELRYGW